MAPGRPSWVFVGRLLDVLDPAYHKDSNDTLSCRLSCLISIINIPMFIFNMIAIGSREDAGGALPLLVVVAVTMATLASLVMVRFTQHHQYGFAVLYAATLAYGIASFALGGFSGEPHLPSFLFPLGSVIVGFMIVPLLVAILGSCALFTVVGLVFASDALDAADRVSLVEDFINFIILSGVILAWALLREVQLRRLYEAELRSQILLNAAFEGIAIIRSPTTASASPTDVIESSNTTFARMFGLPGDESADGCQIGEFIEIGERKEFVEDHASDSRASGSRDDGSSSDDGDDYGVGHGRSGSSKLNGAGDSSVSGLGGGSSKVTDYLADRRVVDDDEAVVFNGIGTRADGRTFPVEIFQRDQYLDGSHVRILAVRNISQTVAVIQMQQEQEFAAIANSSKAQFLANISHELRTPIHGIVGTTELLLQEPLTRSAGEKAAIIGEISLALLSTINKIIDHTKLEAASLELESVPCDILRVVESVLYEYREPVDDQDVLVAAYVEPDAIDTFLSDPFRLAQVLRSLVSNAIRFSPNGSVSVWVTRAYNDAHTSVIEFTVRDTGIGLSAADKEAVFEPFTQADVSNTRVYQGTGLGLAIAKALAALFNGSVSVTSTVGAGSTFTFEALLRKPSSVLSLAFEAEPLPLVTTEGLRVLVQCDVANVADTVVAQIRALGGDATVCTTPAETEAEFTAGTGHIYDGVLLLTGPVPDLSLPAHKLKHCTHCSPGAVVGMVEKLGRPPGDLRSHVVDVPITPTTLHCFLSVVEGVLEATPVRVRPVGLASPRRDAPLDVSDALTAARAQFTYGNRVGGDPLAKQASAVYATHHDEDSDPLRRNRSDSSLSSCMEWSDAEDGVQDSEDLSADTDTDDDAAPYMLVVEDNMVTRLMTKEMLISGGFRCDTAYNGVEAVDAFKRHPNRYAVILMDLQMPVMDGFAATQEILSSLPPGKELPIIAVTASTAGNDAERCKRVGMAKVVFKPFKRQDLFKILGEYTVVPKPIVTPSPASSQRTWSADGRTNNNNNSSNNKASPHTMYV